MKTKQFFFNRMRNEEQAQKGNAFYIWKASTITRTKEKEREKAIVEEYERQEEEIKNL